MIFPAYLGSHRSVAIDIPLAGPTAVVQHGYILADVFKQHCRRSANFEIANLDFLDEI